MKLLVLLCAALYRSATADDATNPFAVVLDDVTNAVGEGWHEGSFLPCLEDAHLGMFHHDWARSATPAQAVYAFDPPRDGCYVLEEWHPGHSADCARYMHGAVHLDVHYCRGKNAYTYVDQSQGGGQWNIFGALPFYVGWPGNLTLRNSATPISCVEGSCFWVADAFRLTWVSDLSNGCAVPAVMPIIGETPMAQATDPAAEQAAAPASFIELMQVLVDDVSALEAQAWSLYDGSAADGFCSRQGWGQRFLYMDPSESDDIGGAVFFPFDPIEDGCYLVEEFHPADRCNKGMSSNVQLTIDFCRNQTRQVALDQTTKGNQWSSVALLPFYVGYPGGVRVRHPQVGDGIAVADAFRFTKVAATCESWSGMLSQYQRLAQHPDSITLDDASAMVVKAPAEHSSVPACDDSAFLGSAHTVGEGEASAEFQFEPPSSGCYRVDEFHPSATEGCALADNVALRVDYCLGGQQDATLDLSRQGSQWNVVGHFPFYAGVTGRVTSRRLASNPTGSHWTADAFRFTKVAERCSDVPPSSLLTMRLSGVDLASSPSLLDGQLTTHTDLRLAFHEAVAQAAGLDESAVRLLGLRQGSIITEFELRGTEVDIAAAVARLEDDISGAGSLQATMCHAATVGREGAVPDCRLEIVRTTAISPPASEESEGDCWVMIAIASTAAAAAIAVCAAACAIWRRRRLAKASLSDAEVVVGTPKAGESKDAASDTASTATPEVACSETQTDISGEVSEVASVCSSREGTEMPGFKDDVCV